MVYAEMDRCATDAVQSVTGCSLGKRTLKFVDYGPSNARGLFGQARECRNRSIKRLADLMSARFSLEADIRSQQAR
jgi:formylmethanofuran dehydrogenase subunit E